MAHGYTTSHGMEAGSPPAASIGAVDAFRDVLERHALGPLTPTELRAGLRPLVRRSRESGVTIEQLLVVLKREWAALPVTRAPNGDRGDVARRIERAVTLVIEAYYES